MTGQKEIMGIQNILATLFAATVILAGLTLASVVGVFVSLWLSEWLANEDRPSDSDLVRRLNSKPKVSSVV
jgi:hypothetical protein